MKESKKEQKESKNEQSTAWNRNLLTAAFLLGAIGIALGALGAHALKKILLESELASFETAVRYQLFGATTLMVLGFFNPVKKAFVRGSRLILWGTTLFSGSIYLLLMGKQMGFAYSWIGPITPLGGTLLIIGWLFLLWGVRSK